MSSPTPPRTVLVTGAAKRLGREIALALARDGWQVAVHYRDSVEEASRTVADCTRLAGASAAFRANLANETAVRNLLPSVIEEFGQVDAVVNSAATFEYDSAENFSFAMMEKHLRSNAGAAIVLAHALSEHIVSRNQTANAGAPVRGVVVNLLDQKLYNPSPDFMSYTMSRAALDAASTMLALALAPQLRVVSVAAETPGDYDTQSSLVPGIVLSHVQWAGTAA